jgi:hypothetical protein
VSIVNVPDSLRVVTFPREINITCQVGLSNYERLQPAMFLAVVDYSDLTGGSTRVAVDLARYPEFITSLKYTPKTLEYLIERK